MIIDEYFEFNKYLLVDKNVNESRTKIDISNVKEDEEKIESAIRGLLNFLKASGFETDDIMSVLIDIVDGMMNHPDNLDFSANSVIEEEVNNVKNRDNFIQKIKDSTDTEFIKEVYRAWVLSHLKLVKDEDEDD